jgi:uncharacterized protein (DUF58 family)
MAEAAASRVHLRQEAELAAARLPPLMVAAERVAATVQQGVHGRRRVGMGEAFWQFRRYEAGDSIRKIDWRQSAKTDKLFIRETEWAAAQSVWLWPDPSPSMQWRSKRHLPEKRDRADLVALALSSLLVRAGERVAVLGTGERPISGKVALDRLAQRILFRQKPAGKTGDLPAFEPLPRYATLIFIGDLLAPLEETDRLVRRYAAAGVRGYLFHILDPAEQSLPYAGRTRFEGLEQEGHLLVKRAETVRDEYQAKMAEHQAGLADIARAAGWNYTLHLTDQAPEAALLRLYVHLAQLPG